MSGTDALFTKFEGLFKKYLDTKQFLFLTLEQLGIQQANLRQLFYYSWDKGLQSKQMLLEVLQITYPSGTNEFWGSPAALEDHVLESFALALEALEYEEHGEEASLPQKSHQKAKPGKPADPKIKRRGEIVRNHIHKQSDFFDEEKKQVLLREFEENEIPLPRDRYGLLKYPGRNWQEIMSQSAKWQNVVDPTLARDMSPRKRTITTQ